MSEDDSRRPLASRQTGWAQATTRALARTGITPNQISFASVGAAIAAALAFLAAGASSGVAQALLVLLGALFCQLRLLCNLFDGLVAVEAGKGTADGFVWNEFPDRISDIVIFVGIGYAIGAPALGWAAATFAVLTAYVRELSAANGYGHDFAGPMAKPHRMALVTFAAVIVVISPIIPFVATWASFETVMELALWVVTLGSVLTILRRIYRLLGRLD